MKRNPKSRSELLKQVPRGKWVVLSEDESKILGIGDSLRELLPPLRAAGHKHMLLAKVPLHPFMV